MKKIVLLWFLSGWTWFAYSQTITVREKESGRPLAGVTLISEHPRAFAITNPEGQVNMDKIKAEYVDGVLKVHLPKAETAKTKPVRTINIG